MEREAFNQQYPCAALRSILLLGISSSQASFRASFISWCVIQAATEWPVFCVAAAQ